MGNWGLTFVLCAMPINAAREDADGIEVHVVAGVGRPVVLHTEVISALAGVRHHVSTRSGSQGEPLTGQGAVILGDRLDPGSAHDFTINQAEGDWRV